jgi:hypothetical protein
MGDIIAKRPLQLVLRVPVEKKFRCVEEPHEVLRVKPRLEMNLDVLVPSEVRVPLWPHGTWVDGSVEPEPHKLIETSVREVDGVVALG